MITNIKLFSKRIILIQCTLFIIIKAITVLILLFVFKYKPAVKVYSKTIVKFMIN